jgi:3-deoxy-7-phosphoheptulonate synthase
MSWSPGSWRASAATQLPAYFDEVALNAVETCLASAAPLTSVAAGKQLTAELAEVAAGRGFLLQGGDCAESFAEFGADKVRLNFNLLLDAAASIRAAGHGPVVKVARIAGQFAKPRSVDTETIGGITLPAYRGDIVNAPDFDARSRTPDPLRMLEAHRQSRVTIDLLDAYSAAAYADMSNMHLAARSRLGLGFDHAPCGLDGPVRIFTSHEALLLPYEQALTAWDEASESWWAHSAHMLWLGDRTRQLDSAHVEYARGISNSIAVKLGPSLDTDELLRLIDCLDPANRPGRLVLIGRFGATQAARCLPALMQATRRAGRSAVWAIDPMHGNTVKAGGRKTRLIPDIISETKTFFEVAEAEGVHPGGIHLEMTGGDVTECLGGTLPTPEVGSPRRYLTHCDPRLNRNQTLDVIGEVAGLMMGHVEPATHAA